MTNTANSNNAVDVLAQNGFLPGSSAPRVEDFVRAAKEGWDEVVTAYCAQGMPQDAKNKAFMAAVEGGHVSTIDIMLAAGADIEFKDDSDDTALRTALNWSHPEIAKHLRTKGCDVEAVNKYDSTTLEHAIDKHPEHVDMLLEMGANPNFVKNGRSPVRSAIIEDKTDALRSMLDKGGDVGLILDEHRVTPLHEAIPRGQSSVVSLYVDRGASADARDAYGLTPVDYALIKGDEQALETMKGAEWSSVVAPQQKARADVWKLVEGGELDEALTAMDKNDVAVDSRNTSHETFLTAFARKNHIDGVKRLLSRGAKPSSQALGAALSEGHEDVVAALLEAGASVVDEKGELSGLSGAVWEGHVACVRRVVERMTTEQKQKHLGAMVESAVMKTNAEMIELFIDKQAPLDFHDDIGGDTPLIRAVSSSHSTEIVKALLDGGAKIEEPDSHQCTPFQKHTSHYAYDADSFEATTRLLVERGARFDSINWLDQTPFDDAKDGCKELLTKLVVTEPLANGVSIAELAKKQSWATLTMFFDAKPEVVPELIAAMKSNGIDVDAPASTKVKGLLNVAIEKQNLDVVRLCLENGFNVNRMTSYGWTPLLTACGADGDADVAVEIVRALLDAGADLHARTDSGAGAVAFSLEKPAMLKLMIEKGADFGGFVDPPILWAAMKGNIDAVKILTALKVPLDVRDSYGRTPLTLAIEKEHTDVARMLIDAGASTTFPSRDSGDTPLTAAAKQGDVDVVRLMIAKGADLDAKNKAGESACDLMLRRKALRTAFSDVLLAKGIDVAVPKVERLPDGLTKPKNDAWATLYTGKADDIMSLIESKKLGINEQDAWGLTPLMAACAWRDTDLVRRLLEVEGVKVDVVDNASSPAQAWDYIGFSRDEEIDALLAAKGAENSMDRLNAQALRSLIAGEVKQVFERGELNKLAGLVREKKVHPFFTQNDSSALLITAMSLAEGDEDVVGVLLDLGFSTDVADRDGRSPLMLALCDGQLALVARLVDGGARLDAPGLFAGVVGRGNEESIDWLLAKGADASQKDKRGRTVLHCAIDDGRPDFVTKLVKAQGLDLNAHDADGATPLTFAMQRWRYSGDDCAKALVDGGADVNALDTEGRCPLYFAIDDDNEEGGQWLIEKGARFDDRCRTLMTEREIRPEWPAPGAKSSRDDDASSDDSNHGDSNHDDGANYGGGTFNNSDGGGAL